MPRRNRRRPSRAVRRRQARARDAAIVALKFQTARQTRKQARRDDQKAAWLRLPDWVNRRNGGA